MPELSRRQRRQYIDSKLRVRLRIFFGIAAVLFVCVMADIIHGYIAWWEALLAVTLGSGIGYVFGRMVKITWHEDTEKIISRMDLAGGIAIAAYILLALLRSVVLGEFFSGATLTAITLAAASGILIGRFFGMRTTIQKRLHERVATP